MSRLRYGDVIVELSDLASDILDDIRQQVAYYRASVYKSEALTIIHRRVDHLAFISRILKDDNLAECVSDYRAAGQHSRGLVAKNTAINQDDEDDVQADEAQFTQCSVTVRVMRLLVDATAVIESMRESARDGSASPHSRQIVSSITRHRRDLLAMSRHGSRAWTFLQSL